MLNLVFKISDFMCKAANLLSSSRFHARFFQKFKGLPIKTFYLHRKGCKYRFNP